MYILAWPLDAPFTPLLPYWPLFSSEGLPTPSSSPFQATAAFLTPYPNSFFLTASRSQMNKIHLCCRQLQETSVLSHTKVEFGLWSVTKKWKRKLINTRNTKKCTFFYASALLINIISLLLNVSSRIQARTWDNLLRRAGVSLLETLKSQMSKAQD